MFLFACSFSLLWESNTSHLCDSLSILVPFFYLVSSIFRPVSAFAWESWAVLYSTSQSEKHILFYAVKQALILIDFVNPISAISA